MVCFASALHMFGAFSKLFKKAEPPPAPARPIASPTPQRTGPTLSRDGTGPTLNVPRAVPNGPAAGETISVPYSAIIKLIPQELWGKLAPAGVAGYSYTISRRNVLEQIAHGAVKVSFGELRRGAPAGVFINTAAEDGRLVDLPLSEILVQLHPDSIARRNDQERVEVSDDLPDLFGAKGERLAPMRVLEKKEMSNTSTFARQNVSGRGPSVPTNVPIAPITPIGPIAPIAQPPPNIPPNNIMPMAPRPAAPQAPSGPIRMQPQAPAAQAPIRPSAPIPFSVPKPAAAGPVARPVPRPAAGPVAGQNLLAHHEAAGFGMASFYIALDAIAENWPDGVRQELAQLKMPDAKVALPPVEVCEGLKRARIQFPWRTLRSWIQPTPIYATPSPHDDLVLELPLKTLTPLFLDFIRANPVNRQAADAENITEFFKKAEQATGTSPDLLQPLFEPCLQPAPVAPVAPPPPPPPPPAGFAAPIPASGPVPFAVEPTPGNEPSVENGFLCLPLAVVSGNWPEPVVRDIAQFGLANSRVEIPLQSVDPGLKAGRVEFAWRELCAWLNPPSKPAQVSMNGDMRVPLPLGLIAPLVMRSLGGAGRRKTAVSDQIPDLFSAAGRPGQPEAAAPEVPVAPVPAPTPAPAPAPTPRAAPPPFAASAPPPFAASAPVKKAPTNLSELFGEPDKKSWTPNEIVQRTATLPNVAGALIALQDGLLVASNMPQQMKTEMLAAFVPQIFGRLNQYAKELQLGEASGVGFTVQTGTLQVFNAGIIYFAVLGRAGTVLPQSELQLIAAELSRHTK